MPSDHTSRSATKTSLHPRNRHRERYDFKLLVGSCPELAEFVSKNKYGDSTIDFASPEAVKMLNTALLSHYYGLKFWDIPAGYLCPPIPGRADYIHYMADLLSESNTGQVPRGDKVNCFDIGVGANCVYPIIGVSEYDWSFIASEVDPKALASAQLIIDANPYLKEKVQTRSQSHPADIFRGVLRSDDRVDLCICNPPFHASQAEAEAGSMRKIKNLTGKKVSTPKLNFGGVSSELWTEGGERRFIIDMINQSKGFRRTCCWFSSLVSKDNNLKAFRQTIEKAGASYKVIEMGQGNKVSRIIAWTFFTETERENWARERWDES
jgi:23S rRNA (adenine1618-N6)-methyltransferase